MLNISPTFENIIVVITTFVNCFFFFIVQDRIVLEAETIFLLMKKGFPISRNVRAQWLLEHLNSVISIQCPNIKNKEVPELEIVSVLPKDRPVIWSIDTSHQFLYKVVSTTSIIFLAYKYRMVFNLDLSPSLATVVSITKLILLLWKTLTFVCQSGNKINVSLGRTKWRDCY